MRLGQVLLAWYCSWPLQPLFHLPCASPISPWHAAPWLAACHVGGNPDEGVYALMLIPEGLVCQGSLEHLTNLLANCRSLYSVEWIHRLMQNP